MNKILANYLYETEDVFENTYQTENYEIKKALGEFSNKICSIGSDGWALLFYLMRPDSVGKVIPKEIYIFGTTENILNTAIQHRYMFAQYENTMWFYNSKYWLKIPDNLVKEFLKTTSKNLGYLYI